VTARDPATRGQERPGEGDGERSTRSGARARREAVSPRASAIGDSPRNDGCERDRCSPAGAKTPNRRLTVRAPDPEIHHAGNVPESLVRRPAFGFPDAEADARHTAARASPRPPRRRSASPSPRTAPRAPARARSGAFAREAPRGRVRRPRHPRAPFASYEPFVAAPARRPPGAMETSLRFDSQGKHLKLFAKEKFSNDDNYVLTVRARRRPDVPRRAPARRLTRQDPRIFFVVGGEQTARSSSTADGFCVLAVQRTRTVCFPLLRARGLRRGASVRASRNPPPPPPPPAPG